MEWKKVNKRTRETDRTKAEWVASLLSKRRDELVEEFREDDEGRYSPDLREALVYLRSRDTDFRYVLVMTDPYEEWTVGRITTAEEEVPTLLDDERYDSERDAKAAVLRLEIDDFLNDFGGEW